MTDFCDSSDKDEWETHGVYQVTNDMGFEVQISRCGDAGRTRYRNYDGTYDISEWREIEHIWDEDEEDYVPTITGGEGRDIPLNLVMRVNR